MTSLALEGASMPLLPGLRAVPAPRAPPTAQAGLLTTSPRQRLGASIN